MIALLIPLLEAIGADAGTATLVASLISGLASAAPEAVAAFNNLKAMNAAGVDPTPEEFKAALAGLDSANQSIQNAKAP